MKIVEIIKSIIFVFLCLVLSSCKSMEVEKREWNPTSCADRMYPMRILESSLTLVDGRELYIPTSGISANGWGASGPIHSQGDEEKAMPVSFGLVFASMLDRKFYKIEGELPGDTIIKYIDKGYLEWGINKHANYNDIIFGVAPGGIVIVWLSGIDNQIEIARFVAEEVTIDIKPYFPGNEDITLDVFFGSSKDYYSEAYARLAKMGMPYGLWDRYREKVQWIPQLDISIDSLKLENVSLEYFNGERKTYSYHEVHDIRLENRPCPKDLTLVFETDRKGIKRVIEFKFDETEIMKVFAELTSGIASNLVVETKDLQSGKVYFQQGANKFEISTIDWKNQWELDKN